MTSGFPIHTVLFDVGQTLLSPDYGFLKDTLTSFGVRTTIEELARGAALAREKYFRRSPKEQWKDYFTFWFKWLGANDSDVAEILKLVWERHQREHLWNWPEPTARETLAHLKQRNLRLGVVSNADGTVDMMLTKLGLRHFFDCVIDSEVVGIRKPDAEIFKLALTQLSVPAEGSIYVGDNYDVDIVGARGAGLTPVLIDPFDVVPEKEVMRIKFLSELPQMIL